MVKETVGTEIDHTDIGRRLARAATHAQKHQSARKRHGKRGHTPSAHRRQTLRPQAAQHEENNDGKDEYSRTDGGHITARHAGGGTLRRVEIGQYRTVKFYAPIAVEAAIGH